MTQKTADTTERLERGPLLSESAVRRGRISEKFAAPSLLRVLVIDDDPVDRLALRRVLAEVPMQMSVEELSDGHHALARLHTNEPDLIFLDHLMPSLDGRELVERARAAGLRVPIVMLTGATDPESVVELMRAGATDYVPKSALSVERIEQSIRLGLHIAHAQRALDASRRSLELQSACLRVAVEGGVDLQRAADLETLMDTFVRVVADALGATNAELSMVDARGVTQQVRVGAKTRAACRVLTRAFVAERAGLRGEIRVEVAELAPENTIHELGEAVLADLVRTTQFAANTLGALAAEREAREARDRVIEIVAHDLRSPLSTLNVGLDLLSASLTDPAAEHKIGRLKRSIGTMKRLVDDLLDTVRVDAQALRVVTASVSLASLLESIAEGHLALAEQAGICLVIEPAPALFVRADAERVDQVLANLVGNALKFVPRGGHVHVRALLAGKLVRLEVEDDGPGVDPAIKPRLFERFSQGATDSRRLGAGLGLHIARGIVGAHGGEIGVADARGRGTLFWFTLPRTVENP